MAIAALGGESSLRDRDARQLLLEIAESHRRVAAERVYRADRIERLRNLEAEVADAGRIGSTQPD